MVSLKRLHFTTYISLCFLPHCCILVGRLDSCFLTHTKKYMTPIYAIIFQKHVKMCVYSKNNKSRCNFLTLLWSTCSKKKVGWAQEVIFSELGFAGSGARKPQQKFKGSALEPFFHVFLSLNGVFIV